MPSNPVFIASMVLALLFLVALVRAMRFGLRHKAQLAQLGIVERSLWWFRLFRRDGFGPESEAERRKLALALLVLGGLFFVTGAIARLQLISAAAG